VHEVVSFVANDQLMPSEPVWANYIKGVVAEYTRAHVPDGKYLCFEAAIASDVPLGAVRVASSSLIIISIHHHHPLMGLLTVKVLHLPAYTMTGAVEFCCLGGGSGNIPGTDHRYGIPRPHQPCCTTYISLTMHMELPLSPLV